MSKGIPALCPHSCSDVADFSHLPPGRGRCGGFTLTAHQLYHFHVWHTCVSRVQRSLWLHDDHCHGKRLPDSWWPPAEFISMVTENVSVVQYQWCHEDHCCSKRLPDSWWPPAEFISMVTENVSVVQFQWCHENHCYGKQLPGFLYLLCSVSEVPHMISGIYWIQVCG